MRGLGAAAAAWFNGAMFSALTKALGQLPDPALRRIVRFGVLGAILCYLSLVALVWLTLPHIQFFDLGWADTGTGIALGIAALILPGLFFPALVTTIMGVWLDDVADAVEGRHYPQLGAARPQGWAEIVLGALRFLGLTVLVNLLVLPLYLILLFTGFSLVLAVLVNGYLLGREYFDLVAVRRLDPVQAKVCYRNNLGRVWLGGMAIALMFAIPLFNLVAPVVATAFMVHLFQSLRRQIDLL